MKSVSIVFIVAIMACVCSYQSVALPFSDSEVAPHPQSRPEDQVEAEVSQQESHWTAASVETNPEVLFRSKRQSHLSLCRYCCNCCRNKGCGFCCRF